MLATIYMMLAAVMAVDARRIQTGEDVGETVSVEGSVMAVVRDEIDSNYNWLVLGTESGKVYAAANKSHWTYEALRKLTDAEIRLTGIVGQFTSWRRFLGYQLTFDNSAEGGFTVLKPAPADPFAVPDLVRSSDIHRRKVQGQVIAAAKRRFFFRTEKKHILCAVPAEDEALPQVGTTVTVTGFPRFGQSMPVLDNVLWRIEKSPAGAIESAEPIDAGKLFVQEGNRRYANNHLCGRVIELAGTVEPTPKQKGVTPDSFALNCDGTIIKIDLGGLIGAMGETPSPGAKVKVAGLCFGDFSDSSSGFPHLEGFTIIPRKPGDIKIIANAPWLTPDIMVSVIDVLAIALVLFVIWVIALRTLANRRARQLVREQIIGARAELKVEERTRLAVELHDSISQALTGIALQIDAANTADGEESKKFLTIARNMLASCRQELNGCLWDLRSRTFEEKDLTEAILRTLSPHIGSAKLAVRFNVPRELLSEATAHAVLRIIRELGVNAMKHGHAENIKIAGEFHDNTLSFSVTDDGRGFKVENAPGPAQGHFGLQGIRERLHEFNGTLKCESEPGLGAKFTVVLHTSIPEEE